MMTEINTKEGKIKLPCMMPVIVPIEKVMANNYNPNHVSENNMQLLLQSIKDNGFCFPVVVLEHSMAERMSATVQFNRARGVHQTDLMGDLVQGLVSQGMKDDEIAQHLGMELEEVYRLKQITGIAELFKNQLYSKSWDMKEEN